MLFSKPAALLLGAALQPALATPAVVPHRPRSDGTKNEVVSQDLGDTQLAVHYYAPDTGCGRGGLAWMGVWPRDDWSRYKSSPRAWVWVPPTTGDKTEAARIHMSRIGGDGEYKIAFLCRDGDADPWLLGLDFVVRNGVAEPLESGPPGLRNEVWDVEERSSEAVLRYQARQPPCGDKKSWVGIWPSDAKNSYTDWFKAWAWVDTTSDNDVAVARFPRRELGLGEFKAVFVCNNGRPSEAKVPWLVSRAFNMTEVPPAQEGQCVYKYPYGLEAGWYHASCENLERSLLCFDCGYGGTCGACSDCSSQCESSE